MLVTKEKCLTHVNVENNQLSFGFLIVFDFQ